MRHADVLRAELETKAGCAFSAEVVTTPWCSAGLRGSQYVFDLRLQGPDANGAASRLLENLADHDFTVGNDFVADIAGNVVGRGTEVRVILEALVVEAG